MDRVEEEFDLGAEEAARVGAEKEKLFLSPPPDNSFQLSPTSASRAGPRRGSGAGRSRPPSPSSCRARLSPEPRRGKQGPPPSPFVVVLEDEALVAPSAIAGATPSPFDEPATAVPAPLELLPVAILQKIVNLLDDYAMHEVPRQWLDETVLTQVEARKLSNSMVSFLLTSKRIYTAAMRRGGIPTSRPFFCLIHFAQTGEESRLRDMLEVIGQPARISALLDKALISACSSSNTRTVVNTVGLLLAHGANVHTQHFVGQPIHIAARRGNEALVQLLIDYGADIRGVDGLGFDAPANARNSGFFDFADKMVHMKPTPKTSLFTSSTSTVTPPFADSTVSTHDTSESSASATTEMKSN